MSILNKLMDTMRLTENDDDYFDEEDYEEEKPMIKKMEVLPLAVDFRAAQMSAAFNLCDIRISSNRT